MQYDALWLVIAQLMVFVGNALLYGRQKSALDIEKRDRGLASVGVAEALRKASEASTMVDGLRFDNYELLRQKFEAQSLEIASLKAQILTLQESVKSLANKLASRDRSDKKLAAIEAEEDHPTPAPKGGKESLEDLARRGVVVPLFTDQEPVQADTKPKSFGRAAKG